MRRAGLTSGVVVRARVSEGIRAVCFLTRIDELVQKAEKQ